MPEKRFINLTKWNIKCRNCGYKGITYALGSFISYGRLLGYTKSGEIAEFSAWEDPVLQEVFDLTEKILPEDKRNLVSCYHLALGIACDPAPSGDYYDFSGEIKCPNCDSDQINYGPDDPPVVERVNIPLVTYKNWQRLNDQRKRELIEKRLREIGALP